MPKLPSFSIAKALANFDIDIADIKTKQLSNDSRQIKAGDIFCAVIGSAQDGREYIDNAISQGAALVIVECQNSHQHGNILTRENIQLIQFYQLNQHLFELADAYYQSPYQALNMVGITGTNGKTSTSFIIANLLSACGSKSAVIGTLGAGTTEQLLPLENTTPSATQTCQLLAKFNQQRIKAVAMEVSSHALVQKRVVPSLFDIAVFTNLSRDHLDYHETMENYASAKFSLFTEEASQQAIINADDSYAKNWFESLSLKSRNAVFVYGIAPETANKFSKQAKYAFAKEIIPHQAGVRFQLISHQGTIDIDSPLLGRFNVENLMAAISVALASNISLSEIKNAVKELKPAAGRMEVFQAENKPLSIVDYAHTPDGLKNALATIKEHCQGELWLVFGCGGDRDKGKRAEMGAIAEALADHVIVTNDNPRTEAAEMIVSDILSGFDQPEKTTIILNRQQAASSALAHAKAGDAILFAGKGHEQHIVIGTEKIPYNERALVKAHYQEAVL